MLKNRFLYTLIYILVYIKGFIYRGGTVDKEQKLEEAVDFLEDIVDEADNLIYLLQEIEVQLEKLIRTSRQVREYALHTRSLI